MMNVTMTDYDWPISVHQKNWKKNWFMMIKHHKTYEYWFFKFCIWRSFSGIDHCACASPGVSRHVYSCTVEFQTITSDHHPPPPTSFSEQFFVFRVVHFSWIKAYWKYFSKIVKWHKIQKSLILIILEGHIRHRSYKYLFWFHPNLNMFLFWTVYLIGCLRTTSAWQQYIIYFAQHWECCR